ncbi:MAG: 3-hydroxybutyryl-CoA dehydrogenase [Dehalococcoidales bacterium]|nr:3-hydroxybutyryl-CoA dehydrogenase [Dehalococcoidales bacterium]
MEIKEVGVVGSGAMGAGIVEVCAQAGIAVTVSEANDDFLKKGMARIDAYFSKSVEKGKITAQDKEAILARIKGTTNVADMKDCDLIVEAVPEKLEMKKSIFSQLDKICAKETILATNTSALSIVDIAIATNRPDRVLGLHFFNPVPVMKLLEIVRSIATSDATVEAGKEFGKAIGKSPVVVKDTPGFIVNRLVMPFTLDAIRLLEQGIATKEDIDTACKQGLNHPMGPLEMTDFLGNDILYYGSLDMYEKYKDPKFMPPVLLQKMVAAGWLGRKAGKGFYDYK